MHHGVRIKDAALVAAAVLSNRYIADRFLPDKAIDLVDEAAAKLRTEIDSHADRAGRDQPAGHATGDRTRGARRRKRTPPRKDRLDKLEKELAELKEQDRRARRRSGKRKSKAVQQVSGDCASRSNRPSVEIEQAKRQLRLRQGQPSCKYGKLAELERQLKDWRQRASRERRDRRPAHQGRSRRRGHRRGRQPLDRHSRRRSCSKARVQKLLHLDEELHQRVIGQDEAVHGRGRGGDAGPLRPEGSAIGRSARSSSWARPASARPSWPAPWPSSCSTTKRR